MLCSSKQRQLCGLKECKICFDRSFASYEGKTPNGKLKVNCWDYEKNREMTPFNIFKGSEKKCWFKCDNCSHNFNCMPSNLTKKNEKRWCPFCNSKKLCDDEKCKICFDKSFASYNDKTPLGILKINCWDNDKNKDIKPRNIFKNSDKRIWFKCDKCYHSFDTQLKHINHGTWCPYCSIPPKKLCNDTNCKICFVKSFASFEGKTQSGKLKIDCWDIDKNKDIKPRNIFKNSLTQIWFKCDNCNHSFKNLPSCIISGDWCTYCSNHTLCNDIKCIICFEKSFANYKGTTIKGKLKIDCWDNDKNKNIKPRNIFMSSNKKYWFKCDNCPHLFYSAINHITSKDCRWCPYCCVPSKKFCTDKKCLSCYEKTMANYKRTTPKGKLKIECWDNDKNGNIKPEDIFMSTCKKYWFKCDSCENKFNIAGNSLVRGNWCPHCHNKTEGLFKNWFEKNYQLFDLTYQAKYKWCISPYTNKYLPFDFSIEEYKLIIEIDGRQHFQQVSNWKPPEEIFKIDTYKIQQAINNGFTIIRIFQEDIYNNLNNWDIKLKKVIKLYDTPKIICIGCDILYEKYNRLI